MLPLSCSFYRSHIVLDYFLVSTWEIAREGVLQDLLENASWRKNRSFLETSIDWFGLAFGLLLVSPYSYSSIALTYFQSANYRSLELRSMWENLLVERTHPFLYPLDCIQLQGSIFSEPEVSYKKFWFKSSTEKEPDWVGLEWESFQKKPLSERASCTRRSGLRDLFNHPMRSSFVQFFWVNLFE